MEKAAFPACGISFSFPTYCISLGLLLHALCLLLAEKLRFSHTGATTNVFSTVISRGQSWWEFRNRRPAAHRVRASVSVPLAALWRGCCSAAARQPWNCSHVAKAHCLLDAQQPIFFFLALRSTPPRKQPSHVAVDTTGPVFAVSLSCFLSRGHFWRAISRCMCVCVFVCARMCVCVNVMASHAIAKPREILVASIIIMPYASDVLLS